MFIVWGKRKVHEYRGGAAEFCPICRCLQLHGVRDIRLAGHLYWVPIGRGKEIEQECSCIGCFRRFYVPPGTYRFFVDDPETDPLELMQKTEPERLDQLSKRLVLEERLRGTGQPLTRDERTELIAEPFYALDEKYERWTSRESRNVPGALLSLVVTVALFSAFLVTGVIRDQPAEAMPAKAWTLLGLTALSLAVTVYLTATRARRFARRHALPLLVKSLTPLQPSRTEVADILEHLRDDGLTIGTKLRPEWLIEALGTSGAMRAHDQLALR